MNVRNSEVLVELVGGRAVEDELADDAECDWGEGRCERGGREREADVPFSPCMRPCIAWMAVKPLWI